MCNQEKLKIYRCNTCKKVLVLLNNTYAPTICCGEEMELLIAKTNEDGLTEKHVPHIQCDKSRLTVQIGETIHPMTDNHYIEFVVLETNFGFHVHYFEMGDMPKVCFNLSENEQAKVVYSYCNIHGLWKKIIPANLKICK